MWGWLLGAVRLVPWEVRRKQLGRREVSQALRATGPRSTPLSRRELAEIVENEVDLPPRVEKDPRRGGAAGRSSRTRSSAPVEAETVRAAEQEPSVAAARALQKYEQLHNLAKGTATLRQVKNSSAGIAGWAQAIALEVRKAGSSVKRLMEAAGFSAAELREAGVSAAEVTEARFSVWSCSRRRGVSCPRHLGI